MSFQTNFPALLEIGPLIPFHKGIFKSPWVSFFSKNMKKPKISIRANSKTIPLDRYSGEWVAFADGKVVCHRETLKRLMEKVNNMKRLKNKTSVLLVPKKNERPYV